MPFAPRNAVQAVFWCGMPRPGNEGAMTEHPTGDPRNTVLGDYIPEPPNLREVAATIHDAEREVYQMTGLDHLTAPAPTMPSGTWEDRTDGYSRAIAHMRLVRLHPRKVRSTAMVTSETATAMRLHRDRMEQMTADREERRAVRRTWRRWFRWSS